MNLRQQLKVINNTIKELKGKLFIKATIDSNLITDSAEKNYYAYSLPVNRAYHR